MTKLFVTGGSGLLGSNIIKTASERFYVYSSYHKNKVNFKNCKCSLSKIDITNRSQLKVINDINPKLIVHCAALTSVDNCENDPENAYLQNVVSTENIVNIAEKNESFLIHISTDAVFDGKKGNYSEEDKAYPINVYGNTKLEAEKIVKKSNIDYCIVRTNIYGWNKLNKFSLAEWMINKLENKIKLNAFYDVKITPILVNNLARALLEIFESNICDTLHISGSESCSKFEFAETIADIFHLERSLINKISVDEIELPAKRGKNLSLNIEKAQSLLNTKLLNVKDGLREMKKLKDDGYIKELKDK